MDRVRQEAVSWDGCVNVLLRVVFGHRENKAGA
jgi:hypothetical protein